MEVDGTAGPETWNAIYNRICRGKTGPARKASAAVPAAVRAGARNRVDDRSEKMIATLLPQVQPYARALVKKAAQHGITVKVIGGLRTYEEQNELFAQGRTKPGRIVRIIISGSPSTSACLKEPTTWANRPSTKRSAPSEWIWDWNGAATGKRSWMNPTFSYVRNGPAI